MSSVKKAIKSIKSHIENGEPESAVYEATELLKTLDPKQPEAVQVYVGTISVSATSQCIRLGNDHEGLLTLRLIYRGLALTQTGNKDEAEKVSMSRSGETKSSAS